MDPVMEAIMAMFAGTNPEKAGPMLDAAGVPLPAGLGKPEMGAMIYGEQAGPPVPPGVGPAGTGPSGNVAGAAGGLNPQMLAALQGVKAPAPIQPIMNGGVTGGVKAPDQDLKNMGSGSGAIQALMASLLQPRQNPLTVPNLGSLIGR